MHLWSLQSHFPQFTLFPVTGLLPMLGEVPKRAVNTSWLLTLARNSQLISCFSEIQWPWWTLCSPSADKAENGIWCCFFLAVCICSYRWELHVWSVPVCCPWVLPHMSGVSLAFWAVGENHWPLDGQGRCKMTTCSTLTLLWLCLVALGMGGVCNLTAQRINCPAFV